MGEDLETAVQAWFAAWNARDYSTLGRLYSPSAAYLRPDGLSQGAEAIVSYLRGVAEALPQETATPDAVLVTRDAVAVEWSARGADGSVARMAEFFRFHEGRILSQHQFGDPVRTVRLLTAPIAQSAASAPVAGPGETMIALPALPPPPPYNEPAPVAAAATPAPAIEDDWSLPTADLAPAPPVAVPELVPALMELFVTSGPDRGLSFEVGDEPVSLGRAPDNTVTLSDPCTSGHHAQLERQGDTIVLTDLGSTNGTYVNGIQVDRSELHLGDRITVGDNIVTFGQARPQSIPA